MRTPWGKADQVHELAPGIFVVSTPSHGGIKVSPKMNKQIPEYMRTKGGWYEEDCEWSIPFVVFEGLLMMAAVTNSDSYTLTTIRTREHITTFCNWFPEHFEQFFGVILAEGESSGRDKQIWKQRHANDLQVVSAFGDWHNNVPKGMVGVVACVGGRNNNGQYASKERYFLVPNEEYAQRSGHAFIVNPIKHKEIARFF